MFPIYGVNIYDRVHQVGFGGIEIQRAGIPTDQFFGDFDNQAGSGCGGSGGTKAVGEFGKRGFTAFALAAFGDIASGGGNADDFSTRILDRRSRKRDFDGSAILAETDGFEMADFTAPDLFDDMGLLLRAIRGEHPGDRLPEHLCRAITVYALGARVPTHHGTIEVLADNGVVRGFDDSLE